MQLFHTLLSLVLTSALVCASPVDRSFLAKRQDYVDIVLVTITSAYTVTVSNTLPPVTETVTVHAAFANALHSPATVGTTTTEEIIAPVVVTPTTTPSPVADAPIADVQQITTPTPAAAAAPSPAINNAVSSNSAGSPFTGQGTYYSTGCIILSQKMANVL